MPDAIVCDTSVWLYLGRIAQVACLSNLYQPVITTETVCQELDSGRLSRPTTINPRLLDWVQIVPSAPHSMANLPANRLGAGEQSVLAHATLHKLRIVGLDDRQARLLANQMGLHVIGTVGILLRANQAGYVAAVRPLLDQLEQEGFYISQPLRQYALKRANEA